MARFSGFQWDFELLGDGWVPLFSSKKYVAKRPIPFAFVAGSSEVVQILGIGNPTETFTILALDDSVHQVLEALWQAQQFGTLDLTDEFGPSFTYSNTMLTDVGKKRRRPWESVWRIDVEFTQII